MRQKFSGPMKGFALVAVASAGILGLSALPARAADFDPKLAFAAQPLPDGVNGYRSANGAPGPAYWQNRVDYSITARIDTVAKTLTATEVVDYTNNSPDTLPSLWLQLDQNIYRPDSRAMVAGGRRKGGSGGQSEGYGIASVEVARGKAWVKVPFLVSDTRMNIRLDEPLKGHGTKLKFRIAYHYVIPGVWGGRNSWLDTPHGTIFEIAMPISPAEAI